jgi:hypothetical protein
VKPFRGPQEAGGRSGGGACWALGWSAQEAAACRRGALGGDSEVGPRPGRPVDGGGVDAASPFSCAEAEGERNGGGKENWGPDALMMGERGGGVRSAVDTRTRQRRHSVGEARHRHARVGWEERRWRVGRCCRGLGPPEQ